MRNASDIHYLFTSRIKILLNLYAYHSATVTINIGSSKNQQMKNLRRDVWGGVGGLQRL